MSSKEQKNKVGYLNFNLKRGNVFEWAFADYVMLIAESRDFKRIRMFGIALNSVHLTVDTNTYS